MKKKTLLSWSSGKDSAWALHLLRQDSTIDLLGLYTESTTKGIQCMAFGDLFLENVRKCRENQLKGTGIEPLFPLWGIPTGQLADQMLSAGLEAYISSVDLKKLPSRFAGRKWSRDLIAEYPQGTDPCGENGEIHTVVVSGPMFRGPIPVSVGEIIERNGIAYADIIPMS